jgi:lipopolysaccharide export system protein LptC
MTKSCLIKSCLIWNSLALLGAAVNSVQNPAYLAGLEARFAGAARHSRMVRVLRIAVPVIVILAMTAIVAVSIFNPFRMLLPKLPVDMGNLVVSGTKITMESPHLSGYSTDQRPYELWAKTATQDLTDPDHVDLKALRAKILMEDRTTVTLDARNGLFDSKQQLLDLHKDIFLQSSTGYEARLSQAFVDIAKGTVTSEEHVDVKLLNGTLTADRLRITGGGELVRFEGNVVMNLVMDPPTPPGASGPPANTPAAPDPAAQPGKTRSISGKPANPK